MSAQQVGCGFPLGTLAGQGTSQLRREKLLHERSHVVGCRAGSHENHRANGMLELQEGHLLKARAHALLGLGHHTHAEGDGGLPRDKLRAVVGVNLLHEILEFRERHEVGQARGREAAAVALVDRHEEVKIALVDSIHGLGVESGEEGLHLLHASVAHAAQRLQDAAQALGDRGHSLGLHEPLVRNAEQELQDLVADKGLVIAYCDVSSHVHCHDLGGDEEPIYI
mmetsp:Transcript_63533/g.139895  ORF Transcript_63533/g.139895 Transcript_63533/m.139895 type:complete len:225 (-) Transcript_63533:1235-1909(-)